MFAYQMTQPDRVTSSESGSMVKGLRFMIRRLGVIERV